MSFIGEAALSAFMELLIGESFSSALNFVQDHKEVRGQLEEWQSKLRYIQALLNDAEEKQIKDKSVKIWLADLQDLAYDVDDILDEFAYEDLKLQISQDQTRPSKIRKLIPAWFTSHFTRTSSMFNNNMISKIKEITARLNNLASQNPRLELREISGAAWSKGMKARLQPTSLVDEAQVYGREKEKQEILELLKSGDDGVSVISIDGMGGMGKTTLAQLVYNDSSIKNSFDHKAWVCVSDDFDAVRITKTILRSISSESCDDADLNLLQVKLKEKLYGKRFLLVLDDIWNESYNDWTILQCPFGVGTKIIVTTRSQYVSSSVVTVGTFHLDKLSHGDCLSIFTQHAFGTRNFDGHIEFKEVGENILKKCNGLPLAAKMIGGLLRTVTDHDAWKRVLESEIWDLPEQCDIIPALHLSYHHLPSHLKRCFAYCSILPKDYEFEEEEIILLWRAESFLQQKAKSQIQDLGCQYFRDLVSRSFFQKSSKNKSRFVMHDLINDLAQLVAGEICSKLEGDKQHKFSIRTRHSSYVRGEFDGVKVFGEFDQAKYLRTFLPLPLSRGIWNYLTNVVLVDLLPSLKCLRVLSLSGYEITDLPNFFKELKHLHYLDFSGTKIKCLPNSLCILYQLETLILRDCKELEELPSEIENLVNLHYLDIKGANKIKRMPFGIGKLTNLQRLSNFVIGERDGHHIREVKDLLNLRGNFCLSGLENIVKVQDACEAKLSDKLGLDRLELQWSSDFDTNRRNKNVEQQVLNFLRPPNKLQRLIIENYGGVKFSVWIADSSFKNLLSLMLLNCKNCKSLPSVGKLPLLKDLHIRGMDEVDKVGAEFFGENQSDAFASLESLYFENMPNWKEWSCCEVEERVSKFPSLCELSIVDCPQLFGRLPTFLHSLQKLVVRRCKQLVVSISSLPSLCELTIDGCDELMYSDVADVTSLQRVSLLDISKFSIPPERVLSMLTKLEYFKIGGCKELASLSQNGLGLIGHLSSLREIVIWCSPQLVSLEVEEEKLQLGKLSSIESLKIWDCEMLNKLPKILHFLTFLTEMQIYECPSLVYFAENNLPPTLKRMVIWHCKNLQYLVDERENENVSNTCLLESLAIHGCPSLICLSSRGYVPNRLQHLQIQHCPKLTSLFLNAMLPITLKVLEIAFCPELECMSHEFHENTCLESIMIWGCEKIKSLPRQLDKLSHLQELNIQKCSNLISFEESGLPTTNLRVFSIGWCENFGALPKCMNNFTSFRKLRLRECSADISFPDDGFPTSLTSLEIAKAPKIYKSLVEWGLHRLTSLQRLSIGGEGCLDVLLFPEEEMMLPASLTRIDIRDFENLKSMLCEGFQNLTSLQELWVYGCPKLATLPEKDMLLSLGWLEVQRCPLIEEELKRGEGREWSKIAHIPLVKLNGKSIIPKELN